MVTDLGREKKGFIFIEKCFSLYVQSHCNQQKSLVVPLCLQRDTKHSPSCINISISFKNLFEPVPRVLLKHSIKLCSGLIMLKCISLVQKK